MHRIKVLLAICFVAAAAFPVVSEVPAGSDVICPENQPDCYPKVFEATDQFQVVQDGQSVPSGLHIRLNLETGLKEAKLIDPEDASVPNAVEVVEPSAPVDDPLPAEKSFDLISQHGAQKVLSPAKEENIRPPAPSNPDASSFASNLALIKSTGSHTATSPGDVLAAMDGLEDTAHDIYWGLRLCEDAGAVQALTSWIDGVSGKDEVRGKAALLLGTAVQNNPSALKALLANESGTNPTNLVAVILRNLNQDRGNPDFLARMVYLLSELCQDQNQLATLVRADGFSVLQQALRPDAAGQNDGRDRIRQRIGDFFLDHVLREDLSANRDLVERARPGGLAGELAGLCAAFFDTLQSMRVGTCEGLCSEAKEHVREAYDALKPVFEKLDARGAKSCYRRANPV